MSLKPPTQKILLIEDDDNISGPLKWALESRNYSVTHINKGDDAIHYLERASKDSFNLVLLDLMLPGANGWEILIKIRSLSNTSNWPVVMLTAIDDEMSQTRALYDGADDYVVKPFSMNVLLARIEANIRKKSSSILQDLDLHFTDGEFESLSKREKEILAYIVKGYSNKEIAQLAYINEITVGNHISRMFQKLKVANRTQAAVLALKYGLIES
ncbi:MAG: response regulator transcription factor [Cyanobacteriota bacterium]